VSSDWQLVSERPGGSIACLSVAADDVLALSTAAVHRSVDAGATWSTVSAGQPAPPHYTLARTDRSLFVGGASGLFRLRDAGRSWRHVLSDAAVSSLAAATDRTLLAGTDTDGILRSEDGGDTWASGNPGLLDLNVLCLTDGFAGTATGLYRSGNGGRSWREIPLPCGAAAVECASAVDRLVVVGTDAAGAFVSADAGRTWSPVDVPEAAITAVAVDGARMAIAAPQRVYLSGDRGATWRREASEQVVLSLAFSGEHLLAGVARDGVVRFDGGRFTGLHGRVIVDLACTRRGTLLTAGIEDGVARSTDGGRSWTTVLEASASRLAVGEGVVYAATSDGLLSSTDDGCSWRVVHADSPAVAVATCGGVTLAAFEDDRLLVGHDGAWLSHRWDHGRIVTVGVGGDLYVGSLAEQPVVWRSTNGGSSWSPWLHCPGGASLTLGVGSTVLVASDTRVHRLLGATSLPEPVTCLTFGSEGRVYVGTTRGVYVSTDGAEHVTSWSEGLPDMPVLALQASSREVYALVFGGSVFSRRQP
jgi:photosystem II stability/assembly factor-like uncharacterized protein